jgi:hypothetical protein
MGKQTVVALFASRDDADGSITSLLKAGLAAENIGFVESSDVKQQSRKRGMGGILLGASSLALAGGVAGPMVVGLSSIAGAAVAAVVGLAFGGYAGAVLGGLFGGDAGGDDEPYLLREVRAGRVLVSVEVADYAAESRTAAALHGSNALEVDSLGSGHLGVELRHPQATALDEVA